MRRSIASGLTIVELVVVMAVIGILIALILPAVNGAREAARNLTCESHLKQLGLAMLQHHDTQKSFPSGGWGYLWMPDPDRGSGRAQPGSWAYGLLPYLEESRLGKLGRGQTGSGKSQAVAEIMQEPLGLFLCPTRHDTQLYPYDEPRELRNCPQLTQAPKSDYAANGGNDFFAIGQGPASLQDSVNGKHAWADFSKATGICFERSQVRIQDITDGTSRTYLIGEKYRKKQSEYDMGDDQCMFVGYDMDMIRWGNLQWPPIPDGTQDGFFQFGSAHPHVCNFVFADGSVRSESYGIDPELHRRLANRKDGLPTDDNRSHKR